LENQKKKIFEAISAVMTDITAVTKSKRNTHQGYDYRGIDDVYNELHAILARHKVFSVPEVIAERSEERTSKSGSTTVYRILTINFHFYTDDGSFVTARMIGEAMDSGDKASNKAMSVAQKYAFLQVFCIPTRELKDPEHDDHEIKPKEKNKGLIQKIPHT